ncbi:hypothetical protein Pla22_03120 [Rubripirellula amarantea]|uniref:Uncharacterized protein n=1 Tax=Rubripirellula amarantea TaxID=2527999 RepID=A0A5C5WPL5_9BACT|nr:hypothetical protein Pla22_03120 [Rubripirellula amarantea]
MVGASNDTVLLRAGAWNDRLRDHLSKLPAFTRINIWFRVDFTKCCDDVMGAVILSAALATFA